MTLMLSFVSVVGSASAQTSESKGAVESGNLMVSEPKSDFCINSFTDDTSSIKQITDSNQLNEMDGSQGSDEVDLVVLKETEVQDENTEVTKVLINSAIKAAAVSVGKVTHYGWKDNFHGKKMSNGEIFNRNEMTSAVPTKGGKPIYPFGTKLRVTNVNNGKSVVVKVTDTGSFGKRGILLDLSYGAFKTIANPDNGLATVKIEKVQ